MLCSQIILGIPSFDSPEVSRQDVSLLLGVLCMRCTLTKLEPTAALSRR